MELFLKNKILEQKVKNEKLSYDQLLKKVVNQELLFEKLEFHFGKVFKNKIVVKPYLKKDKKASFKRIVNLMLSDLHFGSNLDPREVPLKYGSTEEARRLSAVTLQAANYKRQHREESALYIHLIGDIIQNTMHDPRTGNPLAEQCTAAIHLLIQSFAYLATQYPKVTIFCATGNHGRITSRHRERAVEQKFDSFETIIYFAIKRALAHIPNITVNIPYSPYYSCKAFDKRIFMSHGDSILNPGNPGKSLNVESIRKQTNEINSRLKADEQYSLFGVGHIHFGTSCFLPNGAAFLSNGALIPSDAYALSIGLFNVTCGQWLFESVTGKALGDHRFLIVDEETDKDETLDRIIKPYDSL